MSEIRAGFTFSDIAGESNNDHAAADHNSMINNAVITGIEASEFGANALIPFVGSEEPSDTNLIWWNQDDQTLSLYHEGETIHNKGYQPIMDGFYARTTTDCTPGVGVAIATTTTNIILVRPVESQLFVGCLQTTVASGATAFVRTHGVGLALVTIDSNYFAASSTFINPNTRLVCKPATNNISLLIPVDRNQATVIAPDVSTYQMAGYALHTVDLSVSPLATVLFKI